MKKIIAASAIAFSALIACTKSSPSASQDSSANAAIVAKHGADDTAGNHTTAGIPQAVINSFNARYPNATRAEFQQETEHGTVTYKVKFFQGTQRWIAFFKPDGTFISAR